jgi:lactoylglutathione lyase
MDRFGVRTLAYRDRMQQPELDEAQRMGAARVTAMIEQLRADDGPAADHSRALAELREISRDRVLLGDVLGDYLHRVVVGTQAETVSYWPVLELLRAAGADEERAAAKATWLRQQQTTGDTDSSGAAMVETATLGWIIIYVPDVVAALDFYERAFGLRRTFVNPPADFGQLGTGQTALSFASRGRAEHEIGAYQLPDPQADPCNIEICLVFDDPVTAFRHAVATGCAPVVEPSAKPHGQTTGFVRDPWGTLIEIASPLRTNA